VNTLQKNKTPPPNTNPESQHGEEGALPEFLLSAMPPCLVELVLDPAQQTRPSRTEAELFADGQCEV
jgi:hypothetical protein